MLTALRSSDSGLLALALTVTLGPASTAELVPAYARWHGLTSREQDVLRLLVDGLSTRQIARHLDVSAYTTEDRLKAVSRKTGNAGRAEVVASLS